MIKRDLHWFGLVSFMLGSIIGAGFFDFPRQFSQNSGFLGLAIAWILTGCGVASLSFIFQALSKRYSNLERPEWSDIQKCLKNQYGLFLSSLAAWGYWCSAWIGNLAYLRLLSENVFKIFHLDPFEHYVLAIVVGSLILWSVFFILLKGIHAFAKWNNLLTALKIFILMCTIGLLVLSFSSQIFLKNIFLEPSTLPSNSLLSQIKSSMIYTAWLFLGFEGAVLIGHHAKDENAVKKAVTVGLSLVFLIYLSFSVAVFGSLSIQELKVLPESESLSALVQLLYGKSVGEWLRSMIVLFSAGALLPWTLYAATLAQQSAVEGLMPKILKKKSTDHDLPKRGLLCSVVLTQILLIVSYIYQFSYDHLVTAATLGVIPTYFLTSLLCVTLWFNQKKEKRLLLGLPAIIYSAWLFYGAEQCIYVQLLSIFGIGVIVFLINQFFLTEKDLSE